jgi:hypothetical protein
MKLKTVQRSKQITNNQPAQYQAKTSPRGLPVRTHLRAGYSFGSYEDPSQGTNGGTIIPAAPYDPAADIQM